jgi:glycosyltransferase involved in cell wall biosynthesis
MKQKLAVYLNNFGTSSEVFLIQLFKGLEKEFDLGLYVRGRIFKDSPWLSEFNVTQIPSRKSFTFFKYCLKTPWIFLNKGELRKNYYRFRLDFMKSKKIYYPFLSMPLEYEEFPELFKKHDVYTSVRGTDVTVTPVFKPEVIKKYQKLAPHFRGIHFLSEDLQQLSHEFGIKNKNEKVIYQGVDLSKWVRSKEVKKNVLNLVTVGRLHYIKGLEYLMLVANELNKKNIEFNLKIIGDGPEKEKLEYLIYRLGLKERVILCGKKSHEEIVEIFDDSNVYVHSHLVNGMSNTMLEALAMDLKIVTFHSNFEAYTNPVYSEEIIQVNGYSVDEYARKLESLLTSKEFGNSSRLIEATKREFGFNTHVERFSSFFN